MVDRRHHNLLVWQEALKFVKEIYLTTGEFPQHELYALTSQMRRAAVSIPSNIAEGAGRSSKKEFVHYLIMARGSLCELETQLMIAMDLGYLDSANSPLSKLERLFALLGGLINSVGPKRLK